MQFTTMIQKRSQKEIRSVHSLSNFQLLRRRLLVSRGDEPPSERSIRNRKAVTWHVAGAGEEGWRLWPVNDFTAFSNFLSLTGMSKTGNTYSLFRLPSSFFQVIAAITGLVSKTCFEIAESRWVREFPEQVHNFTVLK